MILLLLLGILVFVGYAARSRRARRNAHSRPKMTSKPGLDELRRDAQYWGVRLEMAEPEGACDPARELMGKNLLVNHAPELPLAGCTAQKCTCHYVGLPQQRIKPRREAEERRTEGRFEEGSGDRREDDRRTHSDTWDKVNRQF